MTQTAKAAIAIVLVMMSLPAQASVLANQKVEGGVLNLGDQAAVMQSRLTDVEIQLLSKSHIGLFGVQFEGHTSLNVDGHYYVGGKAIAAELMALSKQHPDTFKFESCRVDIPEEPKP